MKRYIVSTGGRTETVDASNPMEAAVVRVLIELGQVIEIKEEGVEDDEKTLYVATSAALKIAAEMLSPERTPENG